MMHALPALMKRNYPIEPLGVLFLSARQTFARMAFWVRASVWRLVFSLPLVTVPAATAAFYAVLRDGLRDPFEERVDVRRAYVAAFRAHLVRATVLGFLNVAALAAILFGIFFWASREQPALNYVAAIAIYFLLFWWLCQPFLYPVLVESPDSSPLQVLRQVVRLVLANPVYSFLLSFILLPVHFVTLLLVGPFWFVLAPFLALVCIQGFWAIAGVPIPDLAEVNDEG